MMGTTSSGTLMVLFGMYVLYIRLMTAGKIDSPVGCDSDIVPGMRRWVHATETYRWALPADLPAFVALLDDPEVCRWLWFTPLPPGGAEAYFSPLLEQSAAALERGEEPETSVFVVEADGEFLGHGASVPVEGSPNGYEIGFQLARASWGRGVGTRLGQFLAAHSIFDRGAYRLEANCLEGNAGSIGVLRRLGLELEATLPGYRERDGVRHTELRFGRIVEELDPTALHAVAAATGIR